MELLKHFHELTIYPENAAKLKSLIIDLAIRGKLTEEWRVHNQHIEPATFLFNQIQIEKNKLFADRKIKKQESISIKDDEKPFDLPNNWIFCRIGDIGQVNPRNYADDDLRVSFCPMSLISSNYLAAPKFEEKSWKEVKNGFTHFAENDVVVAKITPCFENSKAGIMKGLINGIGAGTTELHVFRGFGNLVLSEYIYSIFKSPLFLLNGETLMTGSAGQKRVPRDFVCNYIIGLPPYSEQTEIVNTVNKLFNEIEQLEKQTQERIALKEKFGTATLNQLVNSSTSEELAKNWSFTQKHFPTFFNEEVNIKKLRETILQLAVQGKLTADWRKQNPNVEPASELLKRIKAEKEKLIAEKKIKKETSLPPISDEEKPYALPEGWEWCRLGEIGIINPRNSAPDNLVVSFIPMTLISANFFAAAGSEARKWAEVKSAFTHFAENDVVFAKITPCFENSKAAVMRDLSNGFGAGTTELHVFRPLSQTLFSDFIYCHFKSPKFLSEGEEKMTGSAGQKRVPKDYVTNYVIGLPSVIEQKEIVSKFIHLMSLCDELETQVKKSKEEIGRLMEAVLREVFEVREEVESVL